MKDTSNNKATWIWYPGDFEIWLGNIMNSRRTERGAFFPPLWKMDSHYVCVEFSRQLDLAADETITIKAEGRYNVKIDGLLQFGQPQKLTIPAGKHKLSLKVWNQSTPPAIYVSGDNVWTDSTWLATNEDKEWIDETGKASDTSASVYMNAGSWNFNSPDTPPSQFHLPVQPIDAESKETVGDGTLYDFGCETFGFVKLSEVSGNGTISVYYGESREEALDIDHCETLDRLSVADGQLSDLAQNTPVTDGVMLISKAFRFVYVVPTADVKADGVAMLYEYLPEEEKGSFQCNDELVNRMWKVGVRTLQLTAREFFIDGIKRDRWTWSGDAYQSYLMNYYLFFDSDTVRRTTWQLRGKDPITAHINTIVDYTFYWIIGVADYYLYTGDSDFVRQIYPRMRSLMDYCQSRTDADGMIVGLEGDWVFLDWSPEPMDKHGEVSFEQILYARSLEAMAQCAKIIGNDEENGLYAAQAARMKELLINKFWRDDKHAFVHNVVDGKSDGKVTRYSNIFAILFDYLTSEQQKAVAHSVIDNPQVMRITTPYMRFYEMEALCKLGRQRDVLGEMRGYWGGMLNHGATSFWEAYDAKIDSDAGGKAPLRDHLSMYGRPYGKSLCHAWGASPVYLLGKYFEGIRPTQPGYSEWIAEPNLGGLEWMEGSVPTPNGKIHIYMDNHTIKLHSDEGVGWLILDGKLTPSSDNGTFEPLNDGRVRIKVEKDIELTVIY